MIDNEIQGRNYGWIVTWMNPEVFDEDDGRVPIFGPRKIRGSVQEQLEQGEGESFRMFDDDDNEYFRGKLIKLVENDEYLFTPLDDFGVAYGCTYIEYQNASGDWEIL